MTTKQIVSTCVYCGAGCQILFTVDTEANRILEATGSEGHSNDGTLCLKGRYGWDFLNDPQILTKRLTSPLLRKNGRQSDLTPVSWDEAVNFVSQRLTDIKKTHGPDSILCTGSARGPGNEANYVMQKFVRACLGTNNVDHCARICHAASVAGLLVSLGSGAMSLSVPEIEEAEVIFNIGYNGPDSHPIVARRIVRARQKGAYIICADPRRTETARIAHKHLQLKGGSNLALANSLAHVIIAENLGDQAFIKDHTKGFDELKKLVQKYTPEYAARITGLNPDEIRATARIYAASKHSVILWGMGVCQFSQGVEVVKALANLGLLTGNFGRRATGVGPVRGQNNVQGACDMGALPNYYPGYQSVTDPAARAKFEAAWGVPLPDKVGLTLTRVPEFVLHPPDKSKQIRAYWIFGEDPAQSDAYLAEMRETLEKLELVIVQDIYMNKTAQYADVILPSTSWGEHDGVYSACDRAFQRIRKLIEPPAGVLTDWEIISRVSTAMGYPMKYRNTEEIWNELINLCPSFKGATYEKLEKLGHIQWPCRSADLSDVGTPFLHRDGNFATKDGKGVFSCAEWQPPVEVENAEYPLTLSTVREVGHYSVRTMTGNCRTLRNLEDEPGWVQMNPKLCNQLGVYHGQLVKISSKRGWCITRCLPTDRVKPDAVYMTYQWWIGACNELTIGSLDPISNTPEYKYCACRVEKIDNQAWAEKYVQNEYQTIRRNMAVTFDRKGGGKAA
ncbi:MAG: formate dehydrogenase subunit alpha [Deltaproteobacteria bacterium]|jgi:formate dehydrogenase major subunit|nr:formate dehydrogenase subunit alpha [Deltaproteobacteria bacterium]